MLKSLYYLTKLQVCNIFSINEARYSKDVQKKKSVRTTLIAYIIIGVMLVSYSAGLVVALNEFGLAGVTPTYLGLLSMALSFALTFLKSGALFNIKTYEKLAVLPVSNAVLVTSRFLSLYLANFLFVFVAIASGGITYGVLSNQGVWYYFSMLFSSVFLPLLPMVLALTLGAFQYLLLSRIKVNNFMKTAFTLAFVVVCLVFPSFFSEQSDLEFLNGIATTIQSIGGFVVPLAWLAKGVYLSGIGYYFLFVAVSVGVFAVFSFVVGKFYKSICSGLSATVTKGEYSVKSMKTQSPLFALYKRELKGYVSSSLYFINTIIGNALAVVFATSVCFMDFSVMSVEFGVDQTAFVKIIPFIFALALGIAPSTACAISMEGKGWELTKSLPVETKTVMDAKLLTCLTFSIPCSLIGEVALFIGLRPTGVTALSVAVAPIVTAVFVAIVGLFINAKIPMLIWDNEAQPVKQSSSTLLSMLVCAGTGIIPILLSIIIPERFLVFALSGYWLVLILVGVALYQKLSKMSLNDIEKK